MRKDSHRTDPKDLDALFDDWVQSYPHAYRPDFHKDGIVHERLYRGEATRVLYVSLEPNSRGGRYDRYRGSDLRNVWGEIGLGKSFDLNLARWTQVLLDGRTEYFTPDAEGAKQQLRRVAIMNLKKLAGSGRANLEAVSIQAWRDKEYIRRQVALVRPTVVVTCGVAANRLFGCIIKEDPLDQCPEDAVWTHGPFQVLPANHPSLRPKDAARAFERVVQLANRARLGGFATL
jgi:uracil-DNA glycosylase